MKKIMLALSLVGATAVTGCTTAEQTAVAGAAGGAVIGGIAGDTSGALIGAGAGAVAGYLIGRAAEPGQCRYRDRRSGRVYTARC
ncbi:MAG: hypothetical protein DI629_09760 [Mesorhizobium amorphae]|nr:MAG: hypothetical protein DI629_09760 [Mesorhizobium amorphae]